MWTRNDLESLSFSATCQLCRDLTQSRESANSLVFIAQSRKPMLPHTTCTQPAMTGYLLLLLLSHSVLGAFYKLGKCLMLLGTNH